MGADTRSERRSGRVLITTDYLAPGDAVDRFLRQNGLHTVHAPMRGRRDPDDLVAVLQDVDAALIANEPMSADVLQRAPSLRAIVRTGVGYDSVDVAAATELGITVSNLPGINANAVAEYTIGLLLAAARRLTDSAAGVAEGAWPRHDGRELRGATLGLVGYGATARAVVPLAEAFGMRILCSTHVPRSERPDGVLSGGAVRFVEFDELLERSDYVSIHTALTAGNRRRFDAEAFSKMRPTAILVNTARGAIVDEAALVDAVRAGTIAGAALDVVCDEPLRADSPLRNVPGIVVYSHLAGQTAQARDAAGRAGAAEVVASLAGIPQFAVNRPAQVKSAETSGDGSDERVNATSSNRPAGAASVAGRISVHDRLTERPEQRSYRVAVIPGDGIGNEVTPAAVEVLDVLAARGGFAFDFDTFDWSCRRYAATGAMMPPDGMEQISAHDAILLGAVGWPGVPDHVSLWGLLIPIRRRFRQYVNLRPIRVMPGLPGPLRDSDGVDFVVVRENVEGEYSEIGGRFNQGLPEELAVQEAVFTRAGVTRIVDFAFQLAASRRRTLTSATKSNGIVHTMPFWDDIVRERAASHPDVDWSQEHIDALAAKLVLHPTHFDVIVASNLFGDILSDLAAGIAGSIGIAPAANIDPTGEFPSMFEPVHGSAPDIAGRGVANPLGALWSASMMLDHLGESEAAAALMTAIERTLADGTVRTREIGGTASTAELTAAVVASLPD